MKAHLRRSSLNCMNVAAVFALKKVYGRPGFGASTVSLNSSLPPHRGQGPGLLRVGCTAPHFIGDQCHFRLRKARGLACLVNPLWVISGHLHCNRPCPLYPRKRTLTGISRMSAKGAKSRHRSAICLLPFPFALWPIAFAPRLTWSTKHPTRP